MTSSVIGNSATPPELKTMGGEPPPPGAESAAGTGDVERPYQRLATSAVVLRSWSGHVVSLIRAAVAMQDAGEVEPRSADEVSMDEFAGALVAHLNATRLTEGTAKFEILMDVIVEGVSEMLADSYFDARPLDGRVLRGFADVYAACGESLASTRLGKPDAVVTLESNISDAIAIDVPLIASFPRATLSGAWKQLLVLQSVLADFLADMERAVDDVGWQLEEGPRVEAIRLQTSDSSPALSEVFAVWRNGGDLIGLWDDEDDAATDDGWTPAWIRTADR